MIREFAPYLAAHGVSVHAATGDSPNSLPEGVESHRQVSGLLQLGPSCRGIGRIIAKRDIDLVHVHDVDNVDCIQELVARVPVLLHLHNYSYWCPGGELFYSAQEKRCPLELGWKCIPNAYHKRCNNRQPKRLIDSMRKTKKRMELFEEDVRFLVSSSFLKRRASDRGISRDKIHVVPYAIDGARMDGRSTSRVRRFDPGFVLFVGRLTPSKGVSHLIRAFAGVPEGVGEQLVIAGDGHSRSEIQECVVESGVEARTKMVGWCENEELSWLYDNCSMVVMPSLWDEVFGIVGLEAMAAKKPVVAYDVGGISQWLVDGKTGVLVEPGDVEALRRQIERLLKAPDVLDRMGRNGYSHFQNEFTVQEHAKALVSVYENILE